MSTDRYTKTVLTIIAGALVAIVAQNGIKASKAQSDQVQRVAVCELRGAECASIHHVGDAWALFTVSR
jgi:hypothetical protein